VMLNRSDRDPPSLNPCPSFELCQEIRRGPAKSIRARRLRSAKQAGYKPAASSVDHHIEKPCTPGGVHITRMAKSVLDSGWGMLKRFLAYKCEYAARSFEVTSERYTTVTCSHCRALSGPRGVNGLIVRSWVCRDCGKSHDRDVNSARNTVIGSRCRTSVRGNELSYSLIPPSNAYRVREAGIESARTAA
jgi:transposase